MVNKTIKDLNRLNKLSIKEAKKVFLQLGVDKNILETLIKIFHREYRYSPKTHPRPSLITNILLSQSMIVPEAVQMNPALMGGIVTQSSLVNNPHSWYWLNKDLAEDFNLTQFPLFIPKKFTLPKCGIIILPNLLIQEEDETVYFIAYNLVNSSERIYPINNEGDITLNLLPNCWGLAWVAFESDGSIYGGIVGLKPNNYDEFELYMDDQEYLIQLSKQQSVESKLLSLLINCLLYSNSKNTDIKEIIINKGFGKKQNSNSLYSPLWIGKNYQSKIKHISKGSHASPRLHVRRGHWRSVPYGEKRSLRKQVWIQPTVVGAKG